VIVRFANDLDDASRDELMTILRQVAPPARTGMDLGHRGPDGRELTITLAVVSTVLAQDATETVAGLGLTARDWLRSVRHHGALRVIVQDRETGATIEISADDPDEALGLAHDAMARWTGAQPLAWVDDSWQPLPNSAPGSPHVLALADEWFPAHGGISALNRYLCIALAQRDTTVTCVVPSRTPEEAADAEANGVRLVTAPEVPGGTDRERLARKPLADGVTPDIVIGHGRITGAPALTLVEEHYRNAARLHFVHMQPDQIEWHKLDRQDDTATRAEQRTEEERALGKAATRIIAVGPILHEYARGHLTDAPDTPLPNRLDPGFDGFPDPPAAPKDGVPQILMLGRMEDAPVKGLDLAARAIGHAIDALGTPVNELTFMVRGVPEGQSDELRRLILEWAGQPGLHVVPRAFASDPKPVMADIRRSSLVLMPSLEEGFGMVGLEAIAACVPALISGRSGLGRLLEKILPTELARQVVVPVRKDDHVDVPLWAHRIAAVLDNRAAAFETARAIFVILAKERTWSMAARTVLAESRSTGANRA
jgi:glycosyltransferase involved in cell wall biosynthesis